MGYNVMGYSFVGVESFLTVPGLRLWLDSRRMRTIDENGNVLRWSSLYDNKVFTAVEAQRPGYTDPWIDFNDMSNVQGLQLKSATTPEFNFFHDGSPFGYFELMAYVHGIGTAISSRIFTTRQGMGTGANVNMSNTGDRLLYQIVDAGSLQLGVQTPMNSLPQGQVNTFGVTRNALSGSNNLRLYTNNVLRSQSTTSAVASGDASNCAVGLMNNKRYLVGIKLLYDWTGFTSSEVETFSALVRNLLEQEKQNFVYPS